MGSVEHEPITGIWLWPWTPLVALLPDDLGAEPPVGSRGRAPGQRVRGQSPCEAERKLNFDNTITRLILQ